MSKFTGTPTRGGIGTILASEFAELALIDIGDNVGRKKALREVPLQANRSGTLPVDAQLSSVIASGFIWHWLRPWTFGRPAVTRGRQTAIGFGLAHHLLPFRDEFAGFAAAARTLARAA